MRALKDTCPSPFSPLGFHGFVSVLHGTLVLSSPAIISLSCLRQCYGKLVPSNWLDYRVQDEFIEKHSELEAWSWTEMHRSYPELAGCDEGAHM